MGRLLFGIFLIVPLIEIGLFISIGQVIGLWPTLLGVIVTAMIGSAIIRKQGLSLLSDIRATTAAGTLPAQQLAEGMMLGVAGALLLTPGYFTDLCGFLLLVPAIRAGIYNALKSRITIVGATTGTRQRPPQDPDVIDLDRKDWRDDD
ncbi:FxsA family protein [Mariluticola halotolerans]|uniref:FxsA family protein n=1 Tax=Mariluticola halotolerans TaxID=2909283 RepID=UPI0026E1DF19|nr:FxsA family protein [Mariluticola halotolerans]UJQ93468.1 FxsA family protein [Mariluticola halotolerans]